MSAPAPRLAVAITVYRPDLPLLERLIDTVAGWGAPILLQVDGPTGEAIEPQALSRLAADPRLAISQAPANEGIATALNRLAARARVAGRDRVLFLDQDSEPPADMAGRLLSAFAALEASGARPAAVGPRPVARDPGRSKAPSYRRRRNAAPRADLVPVDYLITSGSLVTLEALDAVGPFPEAFRIDAVDVEWCFRAWARGRSVWMVEDLLMPHSVGGGVVRLGPLAFPQQNPARMGTYVRNQFRLLRLSHVPLRWKLRTLLYVPLQGAAYAARAPEKRGGLALALLRAARDGLRRS